MRKATTKPLEWLSTAVATLGRGAAFLVFALVIVQFGVVLARYLFSVNYLWAQELATYLHAAIFMLAVGWTFCANRHVRIDVIYTRLSKRGRAGIDAFGFVFLLLPFVLVIVLTSIGYVAQSWSILEGSPEASGLPGRFLLKTLIPVFALILLAGGISLLALGKESNEE